MLMANLKAVLQRPKVSAKYSRNAFDRSFSVNTSYQLGGLDCFLAQPFIAGSHIKLNRAIFQRTSDVNTAAFPKVDTHVEFFSVPIRLLWMYWNNFKLRIQDFGSTLQGNVTQSSSSASFTPSQPSCPAFDVAALHREINAILYDSSTSTTYWTSDLKKNATGAYRLLSAMGYGQYPLVSTSSVETSQSKAVSYLVNPFKALAYQKVYYDHFRNTAYESNDPIYYNVDDILTSSAALSKRVAKWFEYRYVNYRKDYLQSIYPALNYVSSSPSGLQWSVPDTVMGALGNISGTAATPRDDASIVTGVSNSTPLMQANSYQSTIYGSRAYISVQQVRAAFALDKLLRASAYAPKHVKDQFEARYGVKGVESGNESVRIAAFMNDILISEVVNTANNLGEIGGKGVGYNGFGKDVEFTFKEDSILIGVMYSLPRTSYDATFVENWNAKLDKEDFFVPEFMNLGLQPISCAERTVVSSASPGVHAPVWDTVNTILGYKDRYSEYKVGIDRNLGNFVLSGPLSDFVVHSNYSQGNGGASANYFKVKPTDMDSIFVQASDPGNILTDKFITHLDIKLICNQDMSIHGQPVLGSM